MAKKHSRLARCPACQASLPVSSHGHCPACGKRDSLTGERRREFYEGHKPLAVLMILIVFISPILGVFLEGVPGLLFGVIIPVAGYYLTPYVVLRLTR